jgi:hypothetical protein
MSALEALKLIAPTVHLERNGGNGERGEGSLRVGRAGVLDGLANSARGQSARSIPSP